MGAVLRERLTGDHPCMDQLSVCCLGPLAISHNQASTTPRKRFSSKAQVYLKDLSVLPTFIFPRESAKSSMTGTKSHLSHYQLSIYEAILWYADGYIEHERNCLLDSYCNYLRAKHITTCAWNKKHNNLAPYTGLSSSSKFCVALFKALTKLSLVFQT